MVPLRCFVLVGGRPASGKSTLSRELATQLGLPCLSKDVVKEQLMGRHGPPGTVAESRKLGRDAVREVLGAARRLPGAVVDSTWYPYALPMVRRLPSPCVEVRCLVDLELARRRFADRVRDPRHLDDERTDDELWGEDVPALGVGPLVEVDTSSAVDVAALAARIRLAVTGGVETH